MREKSNHLHLFAGEVRMTEEVTFVVIAYNEVQGIVQCINSILNQESPLSYSVVVVDDGSTDGTADLVETTFNGTVRVIRQQNMGRGSARLTGLQSCLTKYVAMVDADICLPINWLAVCLENIEAYDGVGGIAIPDGDCSTISRIFRLEPRRTGGSISLTGNNSMFRTEILKELGKEWVTPQGEDFRLQKMLDERGYKTFRIPDLIVEHREKKSFRKTLNWFFISGKDATKLWFQYRGIRLPDIVAVNFTLISIIALATFIAGSSIGTALLLIFLLAVGLTHLSTKFEFRGQSHRLLLAWIPNSTLMTAYLIGRVVGIFAR